MKWRTEAETEEAIASEPEVLPCSINPDTHWDTASPDGGAWEITSPLTCVWVAPAQPKRRPSRPQMRPILARKPRSHKKIA